MLRPNTKWITACIITRQRQMKLQNQSQFVQYLCDKAKGKLFSDKVHGQKIIDQIAKETLKRKPNDAHPKDIEPEKHPYGLLDFFLDNIVNINQVITDELKQ